MPRHLGQPILTLPRDQVPILRIVVLRLFLDFVRFAERMTISVYAIRFIGIPFALLRVVALSPS